MAQEERDTRKVRFGSEARTALLKGSKQMSDTVGLSYGPKGLNVIIEKTYGRPMITRDGVTISKEVYSKVRDENMGMQLLNEAAETTVKAVGDGTTQTVVLAHSLLDEAHKHIAAGVNPMELKEIILRDSYILLDRLSNLTKQVKKGQLEQVATVSSGDEGFGRLIAEAVEQVGADGGIITQKSAILDVDKTSVDGYYMSPGYTALSSGKLELADAYIIVSSKRITTGAEIVKLVNKVIVRFYADRNLQPGTQINEPLSIFFYGDFEGEAYDVINANISQQKFLGAVVKSPMNGGDMLPQYLNDLAVYTGGRLISAADKLDDIDESYIGRAEKIRATNKEAIVFGGEGIVEDIQAHATVLKDAIAKEDNAAVLEKLKERLSKLGGKIAIFRVGGANDTQREEREFRIDDAIEATKAASRGGVVAGAGTTLIELSKCGVSELWKTALENTYKRLLANANPNNGVDVELNRVLNSKYPNGFNLRQGFELIDVIEAGVLDPSLVVENVVQNAAATAADLVSVGAVITFVDKKE